MHVYVHVCLYACMYVPEVTHACFYMHVRMYVCTYLKSHMHVYVHVCMYVCTYLKSCMHVYVHAYIYMYVRTTIMNEIRLTAKDSPHGACCCLIKCRRRCRVPSLPAVLLHQFNLVVRP